METHVASQAPWSYGPPGHLEEPPRSLTWDVVVERIARFSRDSLLDMGARVMWFPWQTRMRPNWGDLGFNVTEVYGPNVVGLAAMFCQHSGADAAELDFRLLCWELYSLGSFAPSDSAEADAERELIARRWCDLLGETPFARLDGARVAAEVRGIWMGGRLRANTQQAATSDVADLRRVAILHQAMADLAPDPSRYRRLRDMYFRNDVFRLLGYGASIIGRVPSVESGLCPGRFDVFPEDTQSDEVIDFVQFGRLACTPSSDLPQVGVQLRALPMHDRKLHPTADPLLRRPGIVIDEMSDRRAYLYPSPRRLVRSFRPIFLDEFVEALPSEGALEPPSLYGKALHQHLGRVVDGAALLVEDDCPVRGKRPDAIWCGERFGVVVEAKARLTSRGDPECRSPDSLLVAWERASEPVAQASEFLRDPAALAWVRKMTGCSPAVWVLVILVDERGVGERTQFRHATSRWNLLAGTGLAGLALLSFENLEAAVRTQTADTYGRALERAWTEAGLDALRQPAEEPDVPQIEEPLYLTAAMDLLLR